MLECDLYAPRSFVKSIGVPPLYIERTSLEDKTLLCIETAPILPSNGYQRPVPSFPITTE